MKVTSHSPSLPRSRTPQLANECLSLVDALEFNSPQGRITLLIHLLDPAQVKLGTSPKAQHFNARFDIFKSGMESMKERVGTRVARELQTTCELFARSIFNMPHMGRYLAHYEELKAGPPGELIYWLKLVQLEINPPPEPRLKTPAPRGIPTAIPQQVIFANQSSSAPPIHVTRTAPAASAATNPQLPIGRAPHPAAPKQTAFRPVNPHLPATGGQAVASLNTVPASAPAATTGIRKTSAAASAIASRISDHEMMTFNGVGSFNMMGGECRSNGKGQRTNNGHNMDEADHRKRLAELGKHVAAKVEANSLGLVLLQEVPKNTTAAHAEFRASLGRHLPANWQTDPALHTFTQGENFSQQIVYDQNKLQLLKSPRDFYTNPALKKQLDDLGEQAGRVQFSLFKDRKTGEQILIANVHAKWIARDELASKEKLARIVRDMAASLNNARLILGGDFNVDNAKLSASVQQAGQTPLVAATNARNIAYDAATGKSVDQKVDLILQSAGLNLE